MNEEARVGKFIRLFGNIFFTFIFILVGIAAIFFLLKLIFGVLDKFSYTELIYRLVITLVPAVFFLCVTAYYWKRTKSVASTPARLISYLFFSIMIIAWLYAMIKDVATFFQFGYQEIGKYMSFSLVMLAGSVGLIFLTGIIQALAAPAEKEWYEREN